jgi:hypothetical protein
LAKGEAKIADDTSLPLIDRMAICAAGREAQSVFGAPTNHLAGAMDETKIIKLTKHLHEEARSALLNDGYQRAHELIVAHKAKVDRIAENLAAIGSLSLAEIRALLSCPRKLRGARRCSNA